MNDAETYRRQKATSSDPERLERLAVEVEQQKRKTMREITDHKVNGVSDGLVIMVVDAPGAGGANHRYEVTGFTKANPAEADQHAMDLILFQNGPIKEAGVNGITHEVLLAIVIDRLRAFQAGPYACAANAVALEDCQSALGALKARTLERQARGVEGTMQQ